MSSFEQMRDSLQGWRMTQRHRKLAHAVGKRLPRHLTWRLRFLNGHRRWPRLSPPRSFNERVLWRILFDRRPEIAMCCDKLAARRFALQRCPRLPVTELIWAGDDLRELTRLELPERWILKPNNASGLTHQGRGQLDLDSVTRLTEQTVGWLDMPFGPSAWRWPWGYTKAERCYLVERFVGSGEVVPPDLKCYVFDGKVALWQLDQGRGHQHLVVLFSPTWEMIGSQLDNSDPGEIPKPTCLQQAGRFAESLAEGFDALRVDFLLDRDHFYFSELTPYTGDAMIPFRPVSLDFELGTYWPDQERLHYSAKAVKA